MGRFSVSTTCILFFLQFYGWSCVIAKDGLLPNGNFELGPKRSSMKGTLIVGENSLPYWRVRGIVEYIVAGHSSRDMLVVVPEGAHAVRLGNEASVTSHRFRVKMGAFYSLTFHAARTCAQAESLNVSVPPFFEEINIQTVYSSSGWDAYAWGFRAPSNLVKLIIHNPGVEEDPACGPVLDAVALKEMFPPRFTKFNLVKNGGFEEGPYVFHNSSSGVLLPPSSADAVSPLPGWLVESLKAVKYVDAKHFVVPKGKGAVELCAGRESAIAQIVRTLPGKTYHLSFLVGDGGNKCVGKMMVQAFAANETAKVPYHSKGNGGFKTASLTFTAVARTTRITFFSEYYTMRSDDGVTFCGPVLDQVTLTFSPR